MTGSPPGPPLGGPKSGGGAASAPDPALVAAAAMVFVADPRAPVVTDEDAHHLLDVLRLRSGEPVAACDGAGTWVPCRVGPVNRRGARHSDTTTLLIPDGPPVTVERMRPEITVAFTPTKGDRPEWVVQKLTELGVDRIVPLQTSRSVVRWEGERAIKSVDRLARVAREAAAQCRRIWLPEVAPVTRLDGVADLCGTPPALADWGGPPPSLLRPVVAVGPEGGWSEEERATFGPGLGLGPTVLRAETAALAAGALLCGLRCGVVADLA